MDTDLVFAKLTEQSSNADSRLKTLIRKAGIRKNVTFHVARHTSGESDSEPLITSKIKTNPF